MQMSRTILLEANDRGPKGRGGHVKDWDRGNFAFIGIIAWFANWAEHDAGLPRGYGLVPRVPERIRPLFRKDPGPVRIVSVAGEVVGIGAVLLALASLTVGDDDRIVNLAAVWLFGGIVFVVMLWLLVIVLAWLRHT
jgi:hypothetical protein